METLTQVVMSGTVNLSSLITFRNVLYVPNFHFNLISVSQVCEENSCRILFYHDNCFFQALSTDKLMGLSRVNQGLYFWKNYPQYLFSAELNKSLCNVATNDMNFLNHKRLGHSTYFPCPQCPICLMAKQTHAPFPHSTSRADDIFSLIHVDVWGPYHTLNHDGSRFFLTIVDDFSRATWIFLMQSKNQVLSHLRTFLSLSKTQFGKIIRRVRIDNGREFFNKECDSFFSLNGILHESSCTYTPQQNGVVEKKHRHLLEVARALKFQASVPENFWGDCMVTAAY